MEFEWDPDKAEKNFATVIYQVDLNNPPPLQSDLAALEAMTEEELEAAIASDPDANELPSKAWDQAYRFPEPQAIRKKLGMTQQQFSQSFSIPLGTLRDWEQRRRLPDLTAVAYLRVIRHDPKLVLKALQHDH